MQLRGNINIYTFQNGLTIGTWISIQFGGDLPTIITGQIIDLEEDMIGIKTYPGDQIFYIDFACITVVVANVPNLPTCSVQVDWRCSKLRYSYPSLSLR